MLRALANGLGVIFLCLIRAYTGTTRDQTFP